MRIYLIAMKSMLFIIIIITGDEIYFQKNMI